MTGRRFAVAFIVLLAVFSTGVVEAQSVVGAGKLELSIAGIDVPGILSNSTLSDNTVTMSMSVDDTAQTNMAQVSVTATGNWYGKAIGTGLEGIIYDTKGTVKICYIFTCPTANFVGYGTWTGELANNSTEAAGTFHCTLIFTSTQIQIIPLNKPISVSGFWNSTLQSSS